MIFETFPVQPEGDTLLCMPIRYYNMPLHWRASSAPEGESKVNKSIVDLKYDRIHGISQEAKRAAGTTRG
jgi:hypothetical protein